MTSNKKHHIGIIMLWYRYILTLIYTLDIPSLSLKKKKRAFFPSKIQSILKSHISSLSISVSGDCDNFGFRDFHPLAPYVLLFLLSIREK